MADSQASMELDERFFDVSPCILCVHATTRRATRAPASSPQITSLTNDATSRTHLNFHSCSGSAQAATELCISPRRPRAINRASQRPIRPLRSPRRRCTPRPIPSSSCPSCLPSPVTLFPHDASQLQEMSISSPLFPPTTARQRARDS
jgi:hypothetical protein